MFFFLRVTVLTIFFAITLSKAELPGWMDWIIAAYVCFYVVIHMILSVRTVNHGGHIIGPVRRCVRCNHRADRYISDIRLHEREVRKHAHKHVPDERSPQRKGLGELRTTQGRPGKCLSGLAATYVHGRFDWSARASNYVDGAILVLALYTYVTRAFSFLARWLQKILAVHSRAVHRLDNVSFGADRGFRSDRQEVKFPPGTT